MSKSKAILLSGLISLSAAMYAAEPDILVTSDGESLKVYNLDINPSGNTYYTISEAADASLQKIASDKILIIKKADGTTWIPGQNTQTNQQLASNTGRRVNPGAHPSVTHKALSEITTDKKGNRTFLAGDDNNQVLNFRILSDSEHTLSITRLPNGNKLNQEKYIIPEYVELNGERYTVVKIDEKAFAQLCARNKIKDIVFPMTLKEIGRKAFFLNTGLCRIILPDSIESIGDSAFSYCGLNALFTELYIPEPVKSVGKDAFRGISKNTSFKGYFQGNLTSLPSFITTGNCNDYGIDEEAVENYEKNYK